MALTDSGPNEGNAGGKNSLDTALSLALDGWGEDGGNDAPDPAGQDDNAAEADAEINANDSADPSDSVADPDASGDAESDKSTPVQDQKEPKESAPKADIQEAPKHWPEDRRQIFSQLPPDAQKLVLAQEKDFERGYTRKMQQLAAIRQEAEEFNAAFEPRHLQFLQSKGVSKSQAVKDMLALHDFWAQDPVGYVKHVMQVSGIAPTHLGFQSQDQQTAGDPQSAEPEWIDPEVVKLRQQLEAQSQRWAQVEQYLSQQQQSQQQRQFQGAQSMLEQFASSADAQGNPLYPHLDLVSEDMAMLMQADPELRSMPPSIEKLKFAYDKAVYANPDVRQRLINEQITRAREEKEAEWAKRLKEREEELAKQNAAQAAAQAAQKAKAASTVKPQPGSSGRARPGKVGLDDAISAALSKAGLS